MNEENTAQDPNAAPKKTKAEKHSAVLRYAIPVLSFLLIILALFLNDLGTNRMTIAEAQNTLSDSAQEQIRTLYALLDGQVDNLNTFAAGLAERDFIDNEQILQRLAALQEGTDFDHITYALADGICHYDSETEFDISSRAYFKKAMQGQWSMQYLEDSLCGDGPHFVLAVPMVKNGEVIGAVQGSYSKTYLSELLIPEIYDGEAYSFVCRYNGDIVVDTDNPNYTKDYNNFFTALSGTDVLMENGATVEEIQKKILAGGSGTFPYKVDDNERYCAFVPLEDVSATGTGLVMFNVVPSEILNASANKITLKNLGLFVLIILAVALSFAFFIYRERKNTAALKAQRDLVALKEQQYRTAASAAAINVARYDIQTKIYYNDSDFGHALGYGDIVPNMPERVIEDEVISPDSAEDVRDFFEKLRAGDRDATTVISMKTPEGGYRSFRLEVGDITELDGKPNQAILLYTDITDQRERELAYARWQKSIAERDIDSYTIFHCNLTKGASFDEKQGNLIKINFRPEINTFNARTREAASQLVYAEDYERYVELLNSDYLIACYHRGEYKKTLEYREIVSEEQVRWIRLTVEMVQYPDSDDIQVILFYENIDNDKNTAMAEQELSELDEMTGVLNRSAFTRRLELLLHSSEADTRHAFILLDIDGFKRLNDAFGHAVGDEAIADIASSLRTVIKGEDLLGRLGGDEFLVCLKDIPNEAFVEKKAVQIRSTLRRTYSLDIRISASMGIAIFPDDGESFETLYRSADKALYYAKSNGKDTFVFYNKDSKRAVVSTAPSAETSAPVDSIPIKRRILIIDSDEWETEQLWSLFERDFSIEIQRDFQNAQKFISRYGSAVSAVILNMDMSDMDSLALLGELRRAPDAQTLPVIALSQRTDEEFVSQCIERGASECVTKPVVGELIRLKVEAAVNRADNERLRTQNNYLMAHGGAGSKYRTVFENTGTVVIEYDWQSGQFTYDPEISDVISGNYDDRSLWRIFLADMVAGAMDVQAIQNLVLDLSSDPDRTSAGMDVMLKTPTRVKHWYSMNVIKRVNDYNLTSKMVITFADINDDVLAEKKLHFQADHDSLTELLNRSAFLREAETMVKKEQDGFYLLVVCDIDRFKSINERFGREEGDKLLKYTAEKLNAHAEIQSGLCGRLSNDTFALLLPNTTEVKTNVALYGKNFFADYGLNVQLYGSAGVYCISDTTLPMDIIIDRAAVAKDVAKKNYSTSIVLYDAALNEKCLAERYITDHMDAALAAGEFHAYFQPQIDHATGWAVGAEALARWIDPQKGVITPNEFVPVFEKNGFIRQMDKYIWECAAQAYESWVEAGLDPLPISVNVSREDLSDPQFCETILAIIRRHGIPVSMFRLEITESLFAEDTQAMIAIVDKLHDYGFMVEMDDFGSGFSSLNILKDIDVDVIKLDMKFFSGEKNLGRGGIIVNSVIRMARWLGVQVIAEGVETKMQADFLLSLGCHVVQGYLYEKVIPAQELRERYLERRHVEPMDKIDPFGDFDTVGFWNPKSADSQVFNSYIGPALLFEYSYGEFEVLRTNRQFHRALGAHNEDSTPESALLFFCEEDRLKFTNAALDAISTSQPVSVEVSSTPDLLGEKHTLRFTLRLIVSSEDRSLVIAIAN